MSPADALLLDIPDRLDTPRLSLRVPREGDGPALYEAVCESLPDLRRHLASLPWVAADPTLLAFEAYCRRSRSEFIARRDMPFIMFDHDGQRVLGATGLHRPDWSVPRFEIGYWCRSSASGQGLVGEAVQALAALAFGSLQAARLEIVTDSHNERSRRVAERAGFVLEGQLRQHRRAPHGELLDTCLYGRLPAPLDGPRAWTMA